MIRSLYFPSLGSVDHDFQISCGHTILWTSILISDEAHIYNFASTASAPLTVTSLPGSFSA